MDIKLPAEIDREKWAGLLRMNAEDLDEEKAKECESLLLGHAMLKGTFAFSDDLEFEGLAIKRHLEGCSRVVISGVTLGRRIDDLIMRLGVTDVGMAVYADCGASALAEMAADIFEEHIRNNLPAETPHMTCRFSPGYGDLPLSQQRRLVRLLDAERKIGLTLSESDLLVPLKSITGIMGLSDHSVSGHPADCSCCLLAELCIRRKEGNICGK